MNLREARRLTQEETRTELGLIRIHENVIASVASIAAVETPGVKSVDKSLRARVVEILGRKGNLGVNVKIGRSQEVSIEIPLIIKYGFNIPEVAGMVQDSVRQALEKMTNLLIKDINVNVTGIERG
jgi:uncharacterized alkaline shock family protein YloU